MHDTIVAYSSSYLLTENGLADEGMDHISSTNRVWINSRSGGLCYWRVVCAISLVVR
jgi:hypothetical protein